MRSLRLTEVGFIGVLLLSLAGVASAERDKSHKEAGSMPIEIDQARLATSRAQAPRVKHHEPAQKTENALGRRESLKTELEEKD